MVESGAVSIHELAKIATLVRKPHKSFRRSMLRIQFNRGKTQSRVPAELREVDLFCERIRILLSTSHHRGSKLFMIADVDYRLDGGIHLYGLDTRISINVYVNAVLSTYRGTSNFGSLSVFIGDVNFRDKRVEGYIRQSIGTC